MSKTHYTCQQCGGTAPRWLGKCPHCGAWNSLIESVIEAAPASKNRLSPGAASASLVGLTAASASTP
ncbi:MAG: DNA repair protein RadA, partial [Serpentinimonas sp.]|nr:DNA repair protein RadA [Serpentinimonas sp.]